MGDASPPCRSVACECSSRLRTAISRLIFRRACMSFVCDRDHPDAQHRSAGRFDRGGHGRARGVRLRRRMEIETLRRRVGVRVPLTAIRRGSVQSRPVSSRFFNRRSRPPPAVLFVGVSRLSAGISPRRADLHEPARAAERRRAARLRRRRRRRRTAVPRLFWRRQEHAGAIVAPPARARRSSATTASSCDLVADACSCTARRGTEMRRSSRRGRCH